MASPTSTLCEWDFARMIAPVEAGAFFRDSWEQQPLVLARQAPDFYADLLAQGDIDHLLDAAGLRYPEIRLVKHHTLYAPEHYTHAGGMADVGRVRAEFDAGTTIVYSHINRLWEPLATLCQSLEQRFCVEVWAEMFWTPAGSQAFPPHYDPHEEFILQVAGSKHWRISSAPRPLPLHNQPFDPSYLPAAKLLYEVTLHAGDLLYLPRGFIHEAYTTDSASAHLTLDLDLYNWMDFFSATLERIAGQDARFRQSLPVGVPERPEALIREQFQALLDSFLAHSQPDGGLIQPGEGHLLARTLAPGSLDGGHWINLERVGTRSLVRRRAGMHGHVFADAGSATLVYGGSKELKGPKPIEPALRFMAEASTFEIASLPGPLQPKSQLVLARRLLKEGFLTVVRY